MSNLRLQFVLEAVDRATATVKGVTARLGALPAGMRRVSAQFAALKRNEKLLAAGENLRAAGARVAGFARAATVALAAVGAVAGLAAGGINRVADRVSAVADGAIRLGMTTEALSRLHFAAEQSGASAQAMEQGLEMLASKLVEAQKGSQEAAFWLDAVGISLADVKKGMTADQAFRRIAQRFQEVGDAGGNAERKIAVMRALMGRGGADLIQLANGGATAIAELEKRSDELGRTIDGNTAAAMNAYGDQTNELNSAVQGLTTRLAMRLMPAMSQVIDRLTNMAVAGRKDWVDQLGDSLARLLVHLPAIIGALATLLGLLAQLVGGIAAVVDATVGWEVVFGAVAAVIAGKAVLAVLALTKALWGFGAALAAAAAPFLPLIAAASALAAVGVLIYKNWEPIVGFFSRLASGIRNAGRDMRAFSDKWEGGTTSVFTEGGGAPGAAGTSAVRQSTAQVGGTLRIEVDGEGRPRVREVRRDPGTQLDFDVYAGPTMVAP
jgi:hypothetical protein